jgi:peptidoglycan/LPS O-acetylase OafA/YrhL
MPAESSDAESSTPPPFSLSGHLGTLDALRGVAVLLVIARHASTTPDATGLAQVAHAAMRAGWIGVELFFALSGFLITGILVDTRSDAHQLRNFYARRTLRIFPLYFAFLGAVFLFGSLTALAEDPEFQTVQRNAAWLWTYTTNILIAWKGEAALPLQLGHLWSLAVEEQFYLLWPLVVLVVPLRRLPVACLALSSLALAVRVALVLRAGWGVDAAYMLTPARMDALLLGGWLALLVRDPATRALVRRWWPPVAFAAGGAVVLLSVWRGGLDRNDPYVQLVGYGALSVLATALVAGALPLAGGGPLQRVLRSRALQSIGAYSYAIYLVQYPILGALKGPLEPLVIRATGDSSVAPALVTGAVAAVLSYLVARITWVVLEAPMLSLKRYFPRAEGYSSPTSALAFPNASSSALATITTAPASVHHEGRSSRTSTPHSPAKTICK